MPSPSPASNLIPPRRAASRLASFRHAFAGWGYMLRTQRNAWIHATISTLVFVGGLWLGLNRMEWAIILLTIGLVWMAEFVNTALEAVVDLASPDLHPLARVGKDVAAAAVLVGAATAVLVGPLVLGPPPGAGVGRDGAGAAVLVGAAPAVLVGLLVLGPPLWAKVGVLFGWRGL